MMENKNMDELFRQKLQNLEQEPPAYLLENILAGAAATRRKRGLIYWRVAGVAAALLIAFVAGWQFNAFEKQKSIQNQLVQSNQAPKINQAPKTSFPENEKGNQENQSDFTNAENNEVASVIDSKTSGAKGTISATETGISTSDPVLLASENTLAKKGNSNERIMPLGKLSGKIRQIFSFSNSLEEMQTMESLSNTGGKTIDQQIMEQNAQQLTAENQSERKSHWLVGAQVSPAYTVSRSTHSQTYASNMLNSSSSNPVDLGAGISVEYKTGKRWSVQTGVYYSGMGQSSGNSTKAGKSNSMYADLASGYFNTPVNVDVSTSTMRMNSAAGVIELNSVPLGTVISSSLDEKVVAQSVILSQASFVQNFEYVEIPFYMRYTILDSRFDIDMLGGFSSNVLVGNSTYMENSSGQKSLVGDTQGMETFNYSGTLGLGFKYGLSKRIFLNVEPRIKYYLNSLNSNSAVTYKPYTIGVFTGLSYQF